MFRTKILSTFSRLQITILRISKKVLLRWKVLYFSSSFFFFLMKQYTFLYSIRCIFNSLERDIEVFEWKKRIVKKKKSSTLHLLVDFSSFPEVAIRAVCHRSCLPRGCFYHWLLLGFYTIGFNMGNVIGLHVSESFRQLSPVPCNARMNLTSIWLELMEQLRFWVTCLIYLILSNET